MNFLLLPGNHFVIVVQERFLDMQWGWVRFLPSPHIFIDYGTSTQNSVVE